MSSIKHLVSKDYIFYNKSYTNNHELFEDIGQKLEQDGYVKNTYIQALKDREKKFPTGLVTPYVNIAIPHTDASHVLNPTISVITLKEPIKFETMGGNEGDYIHVKIILLLAINDPKNHLDVLQKLIFMLSSPEMENLLNAKSIDEIYNIMINIIKEE